MRLLALATLLGALVETAAAPPPNFGYDRRVPLDVRTERTTHSGAIEVRELNFSAGARRTAATLVRAVGPGRHAGILFVHWLGDPKTTNRSEFLPEARELARHGATSLLVDAMWAKPDWFETRTTAGDFRASVAQVIALRRALDLLAARADVDARRIAYVGHDFGAMYGALVAGVDTRPRAYVFMTPTVTFWEWYLLGKRPKDTYAYIAEMRPLDTTTALAHATPHAVLLQFALRDQYVPAAAAHEFSAALPARVTTRKVYAADHALAIAAARADRFNWLRAQLALP